MTPELQNTLVHVAERKKALDALRPMAPETVLSLRKKISLDWTYESNAIEGNTLTLYETKAVLEDGITIQGKSLREHFEAVNHKDAIEAVEAMVQEGEPMNAWAIRSIHSLVLRAIDTQAAGAYRSCNVTITAANHVPPSHWHLNEAMQALERWYDNDAQALHPIERASQLHTRFVVIHPFVDGNGRTARLLMNFELMKSGYPPAVIRHQERPAYYEALDRAGTLGDYDPMTAITAAAVDQSLDVYFSVLRGAKPRVPEPRAGGYLNGLVERAPYKSALHPERPADSSVSEEKRHDDATGCEP